MIRIFNLIIFLILLGVATGCSKNLMPPDIQGDSILEENVGGLDSSTHDFVPSITEDKAPNISKNFEQEDKVPFSGRPFEPRTRDLFHRHNFSEPEVKDLFDRDIFVTTDKLKDIHFPYDKYDIDEKYRSILRKNADYLKANPNASIEIQGHCDERGTNNYNIALGERRSHSTKMYLVSQGVSARRIHTISYGEERPFCFDSNDACWLKNRRAHFRISE